jgi:hypothetical protein
VSWGRILKKYGDSIGVGQEIIVVFRTALDHVSGLIKESDEDFLVLEAKCSSSSVEVIEGRDF